MTTTTRTTILKTLFWQHGSIGIAAVAVTDGGGEWTAYIGGCRDEYGEDEVINQVLLDGIKLREIEANGLFPMLMIGDLAYRH